MFEGTVPAGVNSGEIIHAHEPHTPNNKGPAPGRVGTF